MARIGAASALAATVEIETGFEGFRCEQRMKRTIFFWFLSINK